MKLEWRDVSLGDGPAISTSLTMAETEELQRLAKDAEVLEVGSAYGYSSVAMALAGGRILAVDPHQWLNSLGPMRANLAAYGIADKVEIWAEDSRTFLPKLADAEQKFDLIWIDGDHEAHAVAQDVANALKLLKPTGTLACHDYDEATCPGVRQALDAWKVPPRLVDTLAVYGPGEW
ncbi:MAG TPA: class I SAM-dependent methyltransferase [Sporichthya sp.]|nr:class I SAM-dependent methyltransferase [Sporichthya sp.]